MPGMPVHLNRPPHSVRLLAWGRAEHGWWACIAWQQRVRTTGGEGEIPMAAWVPADAISKPGWAGDTRIPRIALPADPGRWPAPPGWPSWFAGIWLDGAPALPLGAQLVSGPAWRRNP